MIELKKDLAKLLERVANEVRLEGCVKAPDLHDLLCAHAYAQAVEEYATEQNHRGDPGYAMRRLKFRAAEILAAMMKGD